MNTKNQMTMTEIGWDERLATFERATKDNALSHRVHDAVRAFLEHQDAFGGLASAGFADEAEMNAVLGPAEELETHACLAIRDGEETGIIATLAACRSYYVKAISARPRDDTRIRARCST